MQLERKYKYIRGTQPPQCKKPLKTASKQLLASFVGNRHLGALVKILEAEFGKLPSGCRKQTVRAIKAYTAMVSLKLHSTTLDDELPSPMRISVERAIADLALPRLSWRHSPFAKATKIKRIAPSLPHVVQLSLYLMTNPIPDLAAADFLRLLSPTLQQLEIAYPLHVSSSYILDALSDTSCLLSSLSSFALNYHAERDHSAEARNSVRFIARPQDELEEITKAAEKRGITIEKVSV